MRILDASNKPIAGAQISITAFMPSHGHSSPTVPTVTPAGEGYTVGPVSLFMPGLWEVTIEAEASGARDRATFSFCVAG
ncbi:MAG: FixH family protein [Deltaproteobacteria bacterium]|nr:FixH family protein [Deltaproteobacteria bacterium]